MRRRSGSRSGTVRGQRRLLALLAGLCGLLVSDRACAQVHRLNDNFIGYGAGPVFGYSYGKGATLFGAELSAGSLLLHAALGGIYRESPSGSSALGYLVAEPWFIVGGTFGAALSSQGVDSVLGVWEGAPLNLRPEFNGFQNIVTISVGWRSVGGEPEWYVTPKLWRFKAYF